MESERHTQTRHEKKHRHVFADGPAVVDGDRTRTWAELYDRCARLGDALRKQGCGRGDVVQCMLDNTAEMVEAQQGVAMSGATLGSVNTRLDAATVAYVLEHSDARLFIADERYEATCREALATLEHPPPLVVVGGRADGYEALVASGDAAAPWTPPEDEWDALALNYTSGTTGRPKGVVVHHRGAYVQALSNAIDFGGLPADGGTRYLWTLPMFHCTCPCPKRMAATACSWRTTHRQRLGLPEHARGRRRHERLFAGRDGRRHRGSLRRAGRHAPLRRADRREPRDPGHGAGSAATAHKDDDGRRGAGRGDAAARGRGGFGRHARLRHDRDVRPGGGL